MAVVTRGLLMLLAGCGISGFLFLLLGPIAHWATDGVNTLAGKDKANAVNTTRQVLLTAVGGAAVLVGLAFTARTFYLSRRGQLTDRYAKSIAQLASDKLTERLGGIYALEHLMRESRQDHVTVVQVLAAFIRDNAPADSPQPEKAPEEKPHASSARATPSAPWTLRTDIQAAVTVLARRPARPEPDPIDLSRTKLCRANLAGARLSGARLTGANLELADLTQADLQAADLSGTRLWSALLNGARMTGAHLENADLREARLASAQLQNSGLSQAMLQYADLYNAQLQDAKMAGAYVDGATLTGAQLQGAVLIAEIPIYAVGGDGLFEGPHEVMPFPAHGLTVAQLSEATFDESTELPPALRQAVAAHRQGQRPTAPAEDPAVAPPEHDR